MFKIMMHDENQHGFGVSLVKYENDECVNGFVLNTFRRVYEQQKYALELSEMTGFPMNFDSPY